MSTCITAVGSSVDTAGTGLLALQGMYPVLDPRRTAGPGPHRYGYYLARDALVITVARSPDLDNCSMKVEFVSTLFEPKEIQAFNFYLNRFDAAIGSSAGLPSSMTIQKRPPGGSCATGVDTLVLARQSWGQRKAFYWFWPEDLWDFWGGCTVTFDWFNDSTMGLWGNETPAPTYPLVRLPDATVMEARRGRVPVYYVVFGGAAFEANDSAYLMGLMSGNRLSHDLSGSVSFVPSAVSLSSVTRFLISLNAVPYQPLPTEPVDGTLIRAWSDSTVYVCYGGAKFPIPDRSTLVALGLDENQIRVIPPGGASQLGAMPRDGTLIREQSDRGVYLAVNGKLSLVPDASVMAARCLPWRHVRAVPDSCLARLPRGHDIS
jgi:hypothetical protein